MKTFFFDLDNTLWNQREDLTISAKRLYREVRQNHNNLSFASQIFAQTLLKNHNKYWSLFKNGEISAAEQKFLRISATFKFFQLKETNLQMWVKKFLKFSVEDTTLFKNVRQTLKYLSNRYYLGVITDGFADIQKEKLRVSKIKSFFTYFIFSEEVGTFKPDIRVFNAAIKAAGIEPNEILYIGDCLPSDMVGAKAAGIKFIWFNGKRLLLPYEYKDKIDYEIREFSELTDILKG